jgi:hypothetical protein
MKLTAQFAAIGLCALLVAGPAVGEALAQKPQKRQGASEKVAIDQLPQAVTSAVQKTYPGGTIAIAYKTTLGTDVRYQLWVREAGSRTTVVVMATPDGQIQSGRNARKPGLATPAPKAAAKPGATTPASAAGEPIAIDQLPKAVTKSIKDAYPKDTIIQAFKITSGTEVSYQVGLSDVASLQPMRVFVGADGKIQKR